MLGVVDEVVGIELSDVERAKEILYGYPSLSAGDGVHVAVMLRRRLRRIMSFDRGFDAFPGIERIAE